MKVVQGLVEGLKQVLPTVEAWEFRQVRVVEVVVEVALGVQEVHQSLRGFAAAFRIPRALVSSPKLLSCCDKRTC